MRHLAGDTLSALAKSGALTVAYMQLLSQARLSDLAKRTEHPNSGKKVDLESLFDEDEDLNFDFGG
ncbi:hypothetical protein QC823_11220 [Halomonas vilamensis]|uniref:Uncharacterized protein n=1 Tax=Vreelandella vilamensis TaxID=531309 RepID=A0ABU1H5H5_9GAMM|nr:hypothetical protein [Halomonas vilamensis]MDR5899554.1 hypothetical protein [Halomonas vilamensis]